MPPRFSFNTNLTSSVNAPYNTTLTSALERMEKVGILGIPMPPSISKLPFYEQLN
jgi:hypothetical protein